MILRVFDPTNEVKLAGIQPAVRPPSLKGKVIGFISNGKEGTKGYFTQLDRMLREDLGVADVVWRTKSTTARGRRPHRREVKEWHAVVTGVGD